MVIANIVDEAIVARNMRRTSQSRLLSLAARRERGFDRMAATDAHLVHHFNSHANAVLSNNADAGLGHHIIDHAFAHARVVRRGLIRQPVVNFGVQTEFRTMAPNTPFVREVVDSSFVVPKAENRAFGIALSRHPDSMPSLPLLPGEAESSAVRTDRWVEKTLRFNQKTSAFPPPEPPIDYPRTSADVKSRNQLTNDLIPPKPIVSWQRSALEERVYDYPPVEGWRQRDHPPTRPAPIPASKNQVTLIGSYNLVTFV